MILNLKKPNGTFEIVRRRVGTNLRGLRVISVTLEDQRDIDDLSLEMNQKWLQEQLRYAFIPPP